MAVFGIAFVLLAAVMYDISGCDEVPRAWWTWTLVALAGLVAFVWPLRDSGDTVRLLRAHNI